MNFKNVERLGSSFKVPIPTDDAGLLGRECPNGECEGYFKIKPGTGIQGEAVPCHCPYCGHEAASDQFWTKQQLEYAKSIVLRQVAEAVTRDLKQLEFDHKPRGSFGIGFSLKVKAGRPLPIRYYREQELETHLICGTCALEYSVFGVFAFCPDCGLHNSLQILRKNLELIRKQLHLAEKQVEEDLCTHLLEDALENCVSAFDAFARETCRVRASRSSDPVRARSLSFQNPRRAAGHIKALFGVDLEGTMSKEGWAAIHKYFMRRHLLAHRAGVVDQAYLDATGDSPDLIGRRLSVTAGEVRSLADSVERLAQALVGSLPSPQ